MSTPSASRKKAGAGRPEGAANQHARASSTASPASARSTGGLAESSATGEYEELVAGLLPPQVRFAAGTFDFNQDLQSQQFVEHQAQNAQGSRMLASEWVPTLHALQRFALEGVGSGSASSFADRVLSAWLNLPPPTSQKSADVEKEGEAPKDEKNDAREVAERHLFSKCLQALEEDLAALAGDEGEGDARSTAAAEGGKSKTSTSRVLAQLQKARLFQRGGRLFTSLNADEDAIYTSSDDEVSAVAGDAKDASGLFPKEPSRHDASVLPLRHALRSLRRVQRRRMQAEHLLLQWQGSDGDLAGLQTVLSLWAKDGIYSVAAGVATEAERSAASGGVGGAGVTGDAANSRDWAHAAEELRRIARFREENKAPRRELREWRAAARSLFGDDASTAGLETALASFLPADRACSLSADVFTAAQALVDADERRLVLARLDKFRALRQQTRGGHRLATRRR
ncbi:hypothetical protein BESB_012660 [Besnoitia besnoiti]|uniref:Uncharacterized protein n=1 Tax=Besnoitia besnoiti TaxID=94643 RepID=A0A2A9M636_BESBE|nr:hypothetical protein BESB_012660 [Besnoitia besnoiti]PFH32654.1 hypothetical protein BESB_012660 [Besnoitia besnoiti]